MSIGKQATKGFTNLLYRNVLEKVVGMLAMIILARKLTPYDFGLLSITQVLLYLISMIGTTGLAEFLLAYRKDDTDEIFKSAFWFNIAISVAVTLIFIIAAPFWAIFQKDSRIAEISLLSAAIFLISQLQVIPKTWLSKQLMFQKQVKIQAPFIVAIALGKVVMAWYWPTVYSLLIPTLIFLPIQTLILYRSTTLNLEWKLRTNRWKEIYHFTKHLIASTILTRLADHGDKIILGKFLGLSTLGMYNIAVQLADLISSQVVMVSNNILSSVLPKYVNDTDKLYKHYSSFLKVMAFMLFPFFAILFVAAKPIILFLYGPQWIAAALPLQILVVYAAIRAVTSSYGSLMNTLHLNKESFRINLIYTPCYLIGSVIGAQFGMIGIATSVVAVKSSFVNMSIKQIMQAMKQPLGNWYSNLAPYFINTIMIVIASIILVDLLTSNIRVLPLVQICIVSCSVLVLYYLTFYIFSKKEVQKVSSFLGLTYPGSQKIFNFLFRI
jgi:Membrane protein involved in the export of O-antigen and teichoic acid